jgi:hypothetical protein
VLAVAGTSAACLLTTPLDGLGGGAAPVAVDAVDAADSGPAVVVDASVDADASAEPAGLRVTRLRLVDNDTGVPLAGYDPLADDVILARSALGDGTLEALAEGPGPVGSVAFDIGPDQVSIENRAPYIISSDRDGGGFFPWNPPLGSFVLTVTPYSAAGRTGMKGTSRTVRFTVQP